MRSEPAGYHKRLSGLVIVAMLAGCAQHPSQASNATRADPSSGSVAAADALFDQSNTDPRNGLSALDLEHLGLGDQWNTLDENGDGQISRQEFHRRLDDPALQHQLQVRVQGTDATTSEQAVSASWRLPPEPASQTWQRSKATAPPATLSAPSAAAWGVVPSPDAGDDQAPAEPDAATGEGDAAASTSP